MNDLVKKYIRAGLSRSIGPRRILSGPLRGQKLVTSWHDYPAAILGKTERPLLQWFAENVQPGETWLDVGAHYGYTAAALSRLVGRQGRVYAFEPMLASAGSIARTRIINNLPQLTVVPMALGQCESIAGLRLPTVRGMLDSTIGDSAAGEPFFAASLDWLWPRISESEGSPARSRIHGIKIDVQGMEIQALQGMLATLRRCRPKLVVEIHQGVSRQDLLKVLEDAGYVSVGKAIDQVEGEPQYADNRSYAFCDLADRTANGEPSSSLQLA